MSNETLTEPRKTPQQARSRFLVEQMVEATARVLRHEGLDALTTNRIAEVAGVSIGSLYQYFPSKEALLAQVVERELAADVVAMKELMSSLEGRPLRESFRIFCAAMVERSRAATDLHRHILPLVGALDRERLVRSEVEATREAFVAMLLTRPDELAAALRDDERALQDAVRVATEAAESALNGAKVHAHSQLEDPGLVDRLATLLSTFLLDD